MERFSVLVFSLILFISQTKSATESSHEKDTSSRNENNFYKELMDLSAKSTDDSKSIEDQFKCRYNGGEKRADETKILGGVNAHELFFPWFVVILKREFGRQVEHCGGTLLGSRYVLTAAHCFVNAPVSSWASFKQDENCKRSNGKYSAITYKAFSESETPILISQYIWNENFRDIGGYRESDIAIAVLGNDIMSEFKLPPICLYYHRFHHHLSHDCYALGNGYTDTERPESLQMKRIEFVSCTKKFFAMYKNEVLCVSRGPNKGDSGGPVICKPEGEPGKFYVAGVMSTVTSNKEEGAISSTMGRGESSGGKWIVRTLENLQEQGYECPNFE